MIRQKFTLEKAHDEDRHGWPPSSYPVYQILNSLDYLCVCGEFRVKAGSLLLISAVVVQVSSGKGANTGTEGLLLSNQNLNIYSGPRRIRLINLLITEWLFITVHHCFDLFLDISLVTSRILFYFSDQDLVSEQEIQVQETNNRIPKSNGVDKLYIRETSPSPYPREKRSTILYVEVLQLSSSTVNLPRKPEHGHVLRLVRAVVYESELQP